MGFPGLTVDGKTYAVPVDATLTGLIYRTDRITTAPTSYRDLWSAQYKDKSAIEDDTAQFHRIGAAVNGWGDVERPLGRATGRRDEVPEDRLATLQGVLLGPDGSGAALESGKVVIAHRDG